MAVPRRRGSNESSRKVVWRESAIRVLTDSPLSGANAARMMAAPGPAIHPSQMTESVQQVST